MRQRLRNAALFGSLYTLLFLALMFLWLRWSARRTALAAARAGRRIRFMAEQAKAVRERANGGSSHA